MKKWAFIASIILLIQFVGKSQEVPLEDVLKVSTNFFANNLNSDKISSGNFKVAEYAKNDTVLIYLVYQNNNFLILSNELKTEPVLGYSFENSVKDEIPPQLKELIEIYKNQILEIKRGNKKIEKSYTDKWNNYIQGNINASKASVSPIIKVNWDQGAGWNRFCPEDPDGPAGNVYVGCVAVAMAQAMSVYEYPEHGYDSIKYATTDYGILRVNFEKTTYEWDKMSANSADDYNSLLLYHCAVAVSMHFGPDGSGAYTSDVPERIKKYFDYSVDTRYSTSTGDQAWIEKLKAELDNGRPIIYSGNSGSGTGHAFNIDGYDNNDYFHVNWGWSGSYNGNYKIDVLTPGTHDFSYNNGAVYRIAPQDHSPYSINLTSTSIKEKQPIGTTVAKIIVEDPDEDDIHTFEIEGANSVLGSGYCPFYLDSDTIKIKEEIEYSIHDDVEIKITVTDQQSNTYSDFFTINIIKENSAPTNISLSNKNIDDTLSIGSLVGMFTTTDPDEVDTFTYTFEINANPELSKDNDKFTISNDSLFTNYDFTNYENNECNIYVKSLDCKGETVTKEITLSINNIATAIDKINTRLLEIYPNPASDYLNINSQNNKIDYLEFYDLTGRMVKNIKITDSNTKIDIRDIKSGIILMSVEFMDGTAKTYKILKK